MSEPFTRRAMLTGSLAAAAGIVLADPVAAAPSRTDGFRFAHMTDMHVKPERGSPDGFAKALQSLAQLNPAPQFIITGGDHVMDALLQKRERTDTQWDLYLKVLRENTKL